MEPIYIFTLTGAFAMGAALHARQVGHDVLTQNKQTLNTPDDKENSSQISVPGIYLAAGNLAVIALIATIIYGGQNLAWWIPVSFLVVSFPAIYYIFLSRMLKPKLGSLVYTAFALIGLVPMAQGWMV